MNEQDPIFDEAMRATWRDAGAHLPGQLQLQLTPAMAAQRRAAPAKRRAWWPVAGTFASLAVVAGLWAWSPLFHAPDAGTGTSAAQVAAEAAATPAANDTDSAGLLSRNPDFYAWLGSEEARTLAME